MTLIGPDQVYCCSGKDPSELGILELLPSRGFFTMKCQHPAFNYHGSSQYKWDSGCSAGITNLRKRNPPKKWLFCRELPAHRRGIDRWQGYSAGKYKLMEENTTGGMGLRQEIISSLPLIQANKIKMR
jgi:hypothetical protein